MPLQPNASLSEDHGTQGHPDGTPPKLETANGTPKVYRPADSSTVKKGPPVAPKPAWFRQSLKGLRNCASDPRRLPDPALSAQPVPASREHPGPHTQASSSSIKQRISSFETFGSSQRPDKGAQRLSLQLSSGEATKPVGKHEGGRLPGLLGRGAAPTLAPQETEQVLPSGSPAASQARDPGVSESPHPRQQPSEQTLPPGPDPLLRLLSTQTEESQGPVLKMPSQRARSFPLTRSQSCETKLLDEKTSKLYSISSQVSSAVMKSLLCLPSSISWGQTPCILKEGASPTSSSKEDSVANGLAETSGSDTGFSLK
ncbi:Pro-interleukin-16 [Saguinus oedipus]|uniref:Pro-interleukin-16 n=1 Tax=Saguinus oedipus TaxID=9490 RepID=A0ABQ9TC00_SAGOE|nr:Pro-interleukin-16 [Saguinus oedipus]